MRILVTGATGFVGGHLAEALLGRSGVEVVGLSRRAQWPEAWQHLADRLDLRLCDLCDAAALDAVLRDVQPQQIYHLAGFSHAGRSFQEVEAAWQSNLTATRTLYDAVQQWGEKPRILYVGSGLIYGEPDAPGQRSDERSLFRPPNPYATSKAAADLLSFQVTRFPGLDVVRARPFNHIGPRQSPQFAVASFARQIAAIEQGLRPGVVETGDLRPHRDLTDVRDVVRAYLLLMDKGMVGEAYNVGSGQTHAMQTILDRLIALAKAKVEVRQRADLVRPNETAALCADAGKLRREIGWSPSYTLDQTLSDILDYWRSALVSGP